MVRPGDHIHQIAEYIKKNISKGYTLDSLKFSLVNQGYSKISIDKAVELANQQLASEAPKMKEKPQITYKVIPEVEQEEGFFKWLFKKLF